MANPLKRPIQGIDRFQQGRRWLAFPFATARKFGDDQAGNLAARVAYYGFFSLFPLLLVFVTILGLVLRGHPGLQHRVVNSALANFPVIGSDLKTNVHALSSHATLALVVGIVFAVLAGVRVVKAMENALNTVWNVPFKNRPNYVFSTLRAIVMLVVLGVITLVSAGAASVGGGSSTWWWVAGGAILSLLFNFALFMLAFRILTTASVSWGDVLPGAVVGAVFWTILQSLGGYYIGHQVKGATGTYGTFAVVVGLLTWICLGAQLTLYAAEINAVKVNGLWPRSILRTPPTEADQRELRQLAEVQERRPGQEVVTSLPGEGGPQLPRERPDEVRKAG
jgi:YihY family inner membrane protein